MSHQRCRARMVEPQILADAVLQRGAVALLGRFRGELRDVVRPQRLGTESALDDGLDAIADLCAGVTADRACERALVVVDEQTRGHHRIGRALLALEKLQRAGYGVGRARAELALVVAVEEAVAEVDLRRQGPRDLRRRLIAIVALVGNVTDPSESLDSHALRLPALSAGRRP